MISYTCKVSSARDTLQLCSLHPEITPPQWLIPKCFSPVSIIAYYGNYFDHYLPPPPTHPQYYFRSPSVSSCTHPLPHIIPCSSFWCTHREPRSQSRFACVLATPSTLMNYPSNPPPYPIVNRDPTFGEVFSALRSRDWQIFALATGLSIPFGYWAGKSKDLLNRMKTLRSIHHQNLYAE